MVNSVSTDAVYSLYLVTRTLSLKDALMSIFYIYECRENHVDTWGILLKKSPQVSPVPHLCRNTLSEGIFFFFWKIVSVL